MSEPSRRRGAATAAAPLAVASSLCVTLIASAAPPAGVQQPPAPVTTTPQPPALPQGTFANPVVKNAADPWLVYHGGNYYLLCTLGNRVGIRRSPTLAGLGEAAPVEVWKGGMPGYEDYVEDFWAPELHRLNGKWYVYFTAARRVEHRDDTRRVFCLEATTDDPLGLYTFKGRLTPPDEADYPTGYAIDATVYRRSKDGKLFYLWSGRDRVRGPQGIYIAPMSDPWTVSGKRVRLSTPEFAWEKHGWLVNEGPAVLERGGKTFVVYSASGGTTRNYCLGLLTNADGDLLNAASWTKAKEPVFAEYVPPGGTGAVYCAGHNGFFKSPDGTEDWIVYHGKDVDDGTWGGRHTRAHRVTWRADGTPDFGHPLLNGEPVAVPSGEGKTGASAVATGRNRRPDPAVQRVGGSRPGIPDKTAPH